MNIQEKEFSKTVHLPDELNCKLEESIRTHEIQCIWFDKTARTDYHILWLKVKDKKEIEKSFSVDFQNAILRENQISMVFLDNKDFEYSQRFDDFILAHLLHEDNCLYSTEKITLYTYLNETYYMKLKNSYEEKNKLLNKISTEFIKEKLQGAWQFIIKAFANDITYLELMLYGTSFESKTITQRLLILERFIPEVKKLLVKKDEQTYFLIDYIIHDDDSGYYDDFGKSLQKIQKLFYKLVHQNISQYTEKYNGCRILSVEKKNEVFNHELMHHEALNQLKKFDEVEEIFVFHQITTFGNNGLHEHLYVFVVIKQKVTEELKTYLQHIEHNPIEDVCLTSICYTRYQIQCKLYKYQCFFKKAMKSKNKIFSTGYYPKIHWYDEEICSIDDLKGLYELNLCHYEYKIKPILESKNTRKYISNKMLVDFLVNHFKTFIYSEIIYKPQSKNLITLWNLIIFANSALLEQFSTTEINQLSSLFKNLQNEFIKEGQLLLDESICTLIDQLVTTLFSHLQFSNEFKN
ncbi:hypothetical protein [Faecalibacter macacae]|uniref:Uncharacterized protein n=1 Tax=Faecalibacter macacae TaxID=1859289 RepID=A0A3L9MEQ1_9FLAO|nr:hypothetical protein [Faecalibacter macacae]RLZ09724.1 hypothetical protein EAH69_08020 [Faecalibacter macacae]